MSGVRTIPRLLALVFSTRLNCHVAVSACLGLEGASIALTISGPYALKLLVDKLGRAQTLDVALAMYVGLFVVACTATTILGPMRNAFSACINTRLVRELSVGALAGSLGHDAARSDDSGRVQGLLERLPYSLAIVMDGLIWRIAPLAAQLIIGLIVIVHVMSWTYVAGFAALASALLAVTWLGMPRQIGISRAHNERLTASGALVGDILKNAHRVVSNGAVRYELAGVGASFVDRELSEASMNRSLIRQSILQWLVMMATFSVVMGMAGFDVLKGGITPGDFVLVQAYAIQLMIPLSGVAFVLSQSAGALSAVSEMLDMQGHVPVDTDEKDQGLRPVSIKLDDVSFSYGPNSAGLSHITLDFPAASFTAIVGANGSGKSTLAQLIAGLLTPASGDIRVERVGKGPVTDPDEIARRVFYVPQRTTLFNRSLRANLLYPPCRHDEAAALEILMSWGFQQGTRPIDPDLIVGEAGSALSGGQVQKLELARLMGIKKSCLVLDESTSALDPESEARIMSDLRCNLGVKTTLVVLTHRLVVAQDADQVVWMINGRVEAIGTHHELQILEGYRNLWGTSAPSGSDTDLT